MPCACGWSIGGLGHALSHTPNPGGRITRVMLLTTGFCRRLLLPSTLPIVGNVSSRSWLAASLPIPGPLSDGLKGAVVENGTPRVGKPAHGRTT